MMDVSDGLAKDLHALTPDRATPALDPKKLPRRAKASVREALSDGEDYELLFALESGTDERTFQRAWRRKFPRLALTRIGTFVRRGALPPGMIDLAAYHGHEHLLRPKGDVALMPDLVDKHGEGGHKARLTVRTAGGCPPPA